MVLFDAKRREPVPELASPAAAPQSGLERPQRALVDDLGLHVLVPLYRDGDGGICLCQERERAVAGY